MMITVTALMVVMSLEQGLVQTRGGSLLEFLWSLIPAMSPHPLKRWGVDENCALSQKILQLSTYW